MKNALLLLLSWWACLHTAQAQSPTATSGPIPPPTPVIVHITTESEARKFFAIYANRPNVTFWVGPGTFVVSPITLGAASKIIGQGIDVTTLRLDPHAAFNLCQIVVITGPGAGETIQDLTIDGNIISQAGVTYTGGTITKSANDICIAAVHVGGTISKVKAINCGSISGSGQGRSECFWFINSWGQPSTHGYFLTTEGTQIITPNFPSYDSYNNVWGYPKLGGAATSLTGLGRSFICRDNSIVTPSDTGTQANVGGFSVNYCDSGIVEGNYCSGIGQAFYDDTGSSSNLIIRNNTFVRISGVAINFNGPVPPYSVKGISIYDNIIELLPCTVANQSIGINFYGTNFRNLSIHDNTIRLSPYSPTTGLANLGIAIDSLLGMGNISNNCIDLPNVPVRLFATANVLENANIDYEHNFDSYGEDVIGRKYSRATFIVPAAGWYVLQYQLSNGQSQTGTMTIASKAVQFGTFTLAGGKATIADSLVKSSSHIVCKLQSPSGTPGDVSVSSVSSQGSFTVESTNPDDASTYSYTVDNGQPPFTCSIAFAVPYSNTHTTLQPLYADTAANNASQTPCTSVRSYWKTGITAVEGYFPAAALVTVDYYSGNNIGHWEAQGDGTGLPSPGPGDNLTTQTIAP